GVWAAHWPVPLPVLAAVPVGTGVALALWRWRGHPLDSLAWDVAMHLIRNYRVELSQDLKALLRLANRQRKASRPGRVVTVTALEPGVGATTVALELAVGLALGGQPVRLWEPRRELSLRLGLMAPGRHQESGVELLSGFVVPSTNGHLLVRSIPAGEQVDAEGQVGLVLEPGDQTAIPTGVLPLVNR